MTECEKNEKIEREKKTTMTKKKKSLNEVPKLSSLYEKIYDQFSKVIFIKIVNMNDVHKIEGESTTRQ